MRKAILFAMLALAAACGDEPQTRLDDGGHTDPLTAADVPELGVGEVDGLPGTPLQYSQNGLPLIEGVERPDYADDGINSMEKRRARVSLDNPTGEYRFDIDQLEPSEWVADADDQAGFRNSMDEYTWRLTHEPRADVEKATWRSNIFHGKAFANVNGQLEARGACWLRENQGLDCEFPSKKNWSVKDYFAENTSFSDCNSPPPTGTLAINVGNQPARFMQAGADLWKPEAVLTVSRTGADEVSAYCEDLPGSHFGGIMGRSGGFGTTTRRVTNAKAAYPNCQTSGSLAAFPAGMWTYPAGEVKYDPINLYERGILCNADQNSPDMLRIASINMFAHEFGHFLGFAHFTTGIMATGGNCNLFYSTIRELPAAFHNAMKNFTPVNGTFNFANGDAACQTSSNFIMLPTPTDNTSNFPFGRLFE